MTRIRRMRDGAFAVTLLDDEFIALTTLEADLLGLLADRLSSIADGAIEKSPMFPDAYPGDVEASAEFHALTDVDLVSVKSEAARAVMSAFAGAELEASSGRWRQSEARTVIFDSEASQVFMRNLTDLRLLLAERLGIEHDGDEGYSGHEYTIDRARYWWLGETQERLVMALASSLGSRRR
ncbi:DUF2017 family protein [Humibacter sp. RRB41]|uniref:DUF2017 family protein n=1 Tax=Humibacter sp. RRB41 TaxID=2919946 RepID=UPI001FA973F6|nr:DUF2017 family protein [Humibacter sp. RRB41]